MDLGFSPEQEALRDEFRKALADTDPRTAFDGDRDPSGLGDAGLWQRLAELGWLATLVPETHGGSGLEPAVACMLAEEIGRSLAAVPFAASACTFTDALVRVADVASAAALLPGLADGSVRGLPLTDDCWVRPPRLSDDATAARHPGLTGLAFNVLDGGAATHGLALVGSGLDARLVLIELGSACRSPHVAGGPLDLLHPCASFEFDALPVQVLACGPAAIAHWERCVDSHALFVAFEQLGGAEAALDAARRYSLERFAFGRAIGSFQALKHMMADMLVAIDLARSNCYFGAAALAQGGEVLAEAAAVARISATAAYQACAIGNTQVHGALGVTWESNCHLAYRRAQALAGHPGSQRSWKERLVALLARRADTRDACAPPPLGGVAPLVTTS
jgi:acyl-CoA dehydrogenase